MTPSSSVAPKRLLFVTPGPLHEISSSLRLRLLHLSEHFEGMVFSMASAPLETRIGRFELRLLPHRPQGRAAGLRNNLRYLFQGLLLGLKSRFRTEGGGRWDLVVTYDPLRAGLIGLLIARLSGARFAPEVNGVLNSPANYLDMPKGMVTSLKRRIYPRLTRFVLRSADGVKTLFPRHLQALGLAPARSRIVRSFFDYVDLMPFKTLEERKEILVVGFPFYLKGMDLLMKAFRRLAPDFPDWHLKVLGWYPDLSEFEKHRAGHPRIFHHPPVYHREMPEHIGRCGVLVLPSRTEAMGRVLLEAMAAGKARLGAEVDGIPTVIRPEVDGLLFKAEDVNDLTRQLRRLLSDEDLRRRLGEAGRERAREEFSEEKYFGRLIGFYQAVLRRAEAGSPASEVDRGVSILQPA